MSARATVAVSALALVLLFAPRAVVAQRFHAEGRFPPRFPPEGLFDRGVTFCRLMYESDRREAGGIGWITDYPYAEINFLTRVSELTTTGVNFESHDLPYYYVVRATDKALFNCPFIMASDIGTGRFSPAEIQSLRDFNEKFEPEWLPRSIVIDDPGDLLKVATLYASIEGFISIPLVGRVLEPPIRRAESGTANTPISRMRAANRTGNNIIQAAAAKDYLQ